VHLITELRLWPSHGPGGAGLRQATAWIRQTCLSLIYRLCSLINLAYSCYSWVHCAGCIHDITIGELFTVLPKQIGNLCTGAVVHSLISRNLCDARRRSDMRCAFSIPSRCMSGGQSFVRCKEGRRHTATTAQFDDLVTIIGRCCSSHAGCVAAATHMAAILNITPAQHNRPK
jgi:hypothetical protein